MGYLNYRISTLHIRYIRQVLALLFRYCCSQMVLPHSLGLKQQIHGTIQEQEGKIGESAIHSTLDELCKSQIMCSTYDMVAGVYGDGFPEKTAQKKGGPHLSGPPLKKTILIS